VNGFPEFLSFARGRPEVLAQLRSVSGADLSALCRTYVAIGAQHGYVFTADDVEQCLDDAIVRTLRDPNATPQDLEAIAGGGKESCGDLFKRFFNSLLG
jgi:hypothetical protein